MRFFGYPYNDLDICKNSPDYPGACPGGGAARFVKSRYKRTDSVTAMLDELGWPILSKRRKDARLILFYKIINNLAQVPHEHILIKAYEGIRKKNNHKFRHIAVNASQYRQSFFPKTVGPWNQLSFP